MTDSADVHESEVKAVHDLAVALRNEGYAIGFDSSDIVEAFDEHVTSGQETLDAEDLAAFFVVAHREGQTDYSTSVIVDDSLTWGVIQIQMLGAHFRTVLEALPLDTTELIDAMIDEVVTIDEQEQDCGHGGSP